MRKEKIKMIIRIRIVRLKINIARIFCLAISIKREIHTVRVINGNDIKSIVKKLLRTGLNDKVGSNENRRNKITVIIMIKLDNRYVLYIELEISIRVRNRIFNI